MTSRTLLSLLVVAAVPLVSCGGESGRVTSRQSALKSTSNGQEKWVQSETVFAPGDFVFPMDCLNDEMFEYLGTVTALDHCVPVPGGVHDNWHIFYDPEYFTSADGQQWVFLPGASNSGVQLLEGPGCPVEAALTWDQVAHIPLRNTTTGQKIQFRLNVHIAMNAAGEITREFINFGCTHGP